MTHIASSGDDSGASSGDDSGAASGDITRAASGDLRIAYDVHGDEEHPPLVLVPGLGAQLLFFDDELVEGFIDRAFRVIRLDNRDSGLSSTVDGPAMDLARLQAALAGGQPVEPPYTLSDMAADVVAVLDDVGVDRAHVLGVSLGGLIAQTVAIDRPDRVRSLTLLSSTTGSPRVGQPSPEALAALLETPTDGDRDAVVAHDVRVRQVWSTPDHFDETWTRQYFEAAYDRAHNPDGLARQLAAALSEPDREDRLRQLDVPTLVLHGTADNLIGPDGGARLAELIPGATLVELDGMAHDLPPHYWSPIIEAVTQLAVRSR